MNDNRKHKPLQYSYIHRKKNSTNFKKNSNNYINSYIKKKGLKFNTFKNFLRDSNIKLNNKILHNLIQTEPYSFNSIIYLKKLKNYNNL